MSHTQDYTSLPSHSLENIISDFYDALNNLDEGDDGINITGKASFRALKTVVTGIETALKFTPNSLHSISYETLGQIADTTKLMRIYAKDA